MKKENYNEIPEGFGRFGLDISNPIPVTGIFSSEFYLKSLELENGENIKWERMGSLKAANIPYIIDKYKISTLNGRFVNFLFICPYYLKMSEKSPKGFRFVKKPVNEELSCKTNTSKNKYNLINHFFKTPDEYFNFLLSSKEIVIANNDGTCFASLKKEGKYFLYTLTWAEDGKYIADYIKPFNATLKNIEIFNKGCELLSKKLTIFIDTEDASLVPNDSPAFGILTAKAPI